MSQSLNIPSRGWHPEKVIYLKDTSMNEFETCQMCGARHKGFVHILSHPDCPEKLHVDCICAEKMLDDFINPVVKERELLNQYKRRKNWLLLPWQLSVRGNYFINISGLNIAIFEDKNKDGQWGYYITGGSHRKLFQSKEFAMAAVFDKLWQITHSVASE